jgi:hypothetical protein
MTAPVTDAGPKLWLSPPAPGRAPANDDGTAAQISAARHIYEEDIHTYCTHFRAASFEKSNVSVFEPMNLEVLTDNIVGFANISARDMMDHLLGTYGNITAVDLEINFEQM